jgi:GAF domain-containing protein
MVFGGLLDGLLELTDSEYGFIGEIKYDDEGKIFLQTHAITNIAWNASTQAFYEENAESGLTFANLDSLIGEVMTTNKPVISDNPATDPRACGIPEGHPPLNYFLGIPFFEQGGDYMNGMVGIANKPGGYTQADIEFLEPLVVTCRNLIQV